MKMNKKNIFIICLISAGILSGCASDKQKAEKYIIKAQKLIEQGLNNTALTTLDSIHQLYPQQVEIRKQADTLSWKIELKNIQRDTPYVDSLLLVKKHELDSIAKNFVFEKDNRVQEIGNYVSRTMLTANNALSNYLKPYADEHGNFFITSYYVGSRINYNRIKVESQSVFKESLPADDGSCSTFTSAGTTHEIVLFKSEYLNDIPEFIISNQNNTIKVILLGKKDFAYYMTPINKKAIVNTYLFSKVAKDYYLLELQKKKYVNKSDLLQHRLQILK